MILSNITSEIPAVSGAYAVVITLKKPIPLAIKRFSGTIIEPGLYLYAGSANGPGGIRARLSRHIARKKKIHWHIDHVTVKSSIRAVTALPGGNECSIVGAALKMKKSGVPVPGFGSSDCRDCRSHFIKLPDDTDIGALLAGLKATNFWLAD